MGDIVPQPNDYDKISLMSKTVILGTAGHVDHGKSSLVRALTGTDPDRLKEEKERGITIELGFARLPLPSGTLAGIVDVPGHERFVRTMVAGAAGVDIVLLVVAADEGVMPQTREHLDICRLLAVRHGIVVLNKCDKAESDWMDLQEEEIRALVRGTFLEDAPIVRVSAATGQGLPELVAALDRIAAGIPGKDSSDLFRLPVDRSFSMKGFGTVVTGTVIGGTGATGEEVEKDVEAKADILPEDGHRHPQGIIDPLKVTRTALENAVSIASLLVTTEAIITDKPEKKDDKGGMPGMGGMDMM